MKLSGPIDLIKKSFQIFFEKRNTVYFLKIYSPFILFEFLFFLQRYFVSSQSKALNICDPNFLAAKYPLFLVFIIVLNLLYVFALTWVGAAGIRAVSNVLSDRELNVRETFEFAWKKLWAFFLVSVLATLAAFGGALLLIVPGIVFGTWFAFSKFINIDRGVGVRESLSESRNLVRGKFWAVFGRLLVFGLFTSLIDFVGVGIPYIGTAIASLLGVFFILPYFLLYRELSG